MKKKKTSVEDNTQLKICFLHYQHKFPKGGFVVIVHINRGNWKKSSKKYFS